MSFWKQWADKALKLPGVSEDADTQRALEQVRATGYEPYYTLKYAVLKLEERAYNSEQAKDEREA